eukprot:CAMPEP_0172457066 /NCGR_PEP_ID=MMETSP1065-20121228/19765_1 /TAXON_ID=265537 /ORGANISM="Amphiprora paludosa, Strain CCMP125" /LENGTH=308 /DNA_ID=CAMNT_0013210547 /DNA_START=202 /DNA_END=1128 /DNA_ORIENTATION=-
MEDTESRSLARVSNKIPLTGKMPAKKRPVQDDDDDSINSERSADQKESPNDTDETIRLRREKRLAMNRESARARRKRKKILIETLEDQVSELTKSNNKYRMRVTDLEKELGVAKQTIALLSRPQDPVSGLGALRSNSVMDQSQGGNANDSLQRIFQGQTSSAVLGQLGSSPAQGHTSEALLRQAIQAQGQPFAAGGNVLASAQPADTIQQFLNAQQLRLGGEHGGPNNTAASSVAQLGQKAGTTISIQNPSLNRAFGEALAQERLMLLHRQQLNARAEQAVPSDTASRAILLQKIMAQDLAKSVPNAN